MTVKLELPLRNAAKRSLLDLTDAVARLRQTNFHITRRMCLIGS